MFIFFKVNSYLDTNFIVLITLKANNVSTVISLRNTVHLTHVDLL